MQDIGQSNAAALAASLLDRLRDAWRDFAATIEPYRSVLPGPAPGDTESLRARMRENLEGKGGEVSARSRAVQLGRTYLALDEEGRKRFLTLLAHEFGTDPQRIDAAIAALKSAPDATQRLRAEQMLRETLESPRVKLLAQFTALPEGVKFLVDLRAELLRLSPNDPAMSAMATELRDLLATWFDLGFLELQRITWRSPALVLEKISTYESVHAIKSWQDLKNRLDSDRRFYAFFHPRMPDEPLIFVEVALVRGMAGNIADLLDEQAPLGDPGKADTAIFYSINNAQRGLVGISFGNFLIKRVVDDLAREFANLKNFATLSPIPGFRAWLDKQPQDSPLLPAAEDRAVSQAAQMLGIQGGLGEILAQPWHKNAAAAEALRRPLTRLVARYLLETRKDGRAADPVAHFHLSNGARLERINWLADLSEHGLAQSAAMMVNYLYRLADIDDNHESYTGKGRIVAAASIRSLADD